MPMYLTADYKPEFVSLRDGLLQLAQMRNVGELLKKVVESLGERPHVVLARVWLRKAGDQCDCCRLLARCEKRETCLHLMASAGFRQTEARPDWSRLDGEYSRIPLGIGKIGRVGASGEALVVKDYTEDPSGLVRYRWASHQQIRGLNVQPVTFQGEILGVLAVFTCIPTPEEAPVWLRIYADVIGAAIVNARAFEEIERLRASLEAQNSYLQEEARDARAYGDIIGAHASMKRLLRKVEMVAPTDATVLILGESGTGKEIIARELHRQSARRDKPLIRVNCASVPRELYESEFFGHVKGSFTGAIRDRAGRFEAADGGTLFLDEVGEIPLGLQSKFLRVLQERQYERVGEERTRTIDVRIIAATNRNLQGEVEAGRFRQDLYYRLNVFPIEVPPLRERKEDIPLLAAHFLEQTAGRLQLPLPRFSEQQARLLQSYDWPGNVRELQNAAERALILGQQGGLHFELPKSPSPWEGEGRGTEVSGRAGNGCEIQLLSEFELRQLEQKNTVAALTKAGWRVHGRGGAAELLGVKPSTLISRIKKMGLKKPV